PATTLSGRRRHHDAGRRRGGAFFTVTFRGGGAAFFVVLVVAFLAAVFFAPFFVRAGFPDRRGRFSRYGVARGSSPGTRSTVRSRTKRWRRSASSSTFFHVFVAVSVRSSIM